MSQADATILAIDMGAESSRAEIARIQDGRISLREIHRWPTRHTRVMETRYWNTLYIFGEIKEALRRAAQEQEDIRSLGICSWGVDFGIIGKSGHLLQNPVQYRDRRTDGLLEASKDVMPHEEIYARTGIAFLQFNSLYQWWALKRDCPEVVQVGDKLLLVPDLLHYFLTGVAKCEYTNASTSQMVRADTRDWDRDLVEAFGLPPAILPEIIQPGTSIGRLLPAVQEDTGLPNVEVRPPCTHDTGSAVLAIPAEEDDWAYISCGTWSLMGAELEQPVTTPEAQRFNFTNEGGFGGTYRFLKNIMGLWVLQETRAAWKRRGDELDYAEIARQAEAAPAFQTLLDVDDPGFFSPDDMLDAIAEQCARTGEPVPEGVGPTARAILEAVALRYALTLEQLETVTGRSISVVHLVGGGVNNTLLCQFAADAMNRKVVAGPTECTALGNVLAQALGAGVLPSVVEARAMVKRSVETQVFEPSDVEAWRDRLSKLAAIAHAP